MILVVDASVALKWFFRERPDEPDVGPATEILTAVGDGRVRMVQPPHFLAEVAAVLARETPRAAARSLDDLWRVNWDIAESGAVYALAAELSIRLRHHLFDTLYHAVSLSTRDATLVTADDAYYMKASGEGAITRLADLTFV
jgi:predicted nucleic acid-binding protein